MSSSDNDNENDNKNKNQVEPPIPRPVLIREQTIFENVKGDDGQGFKFDPLEYFPPSSSVFTPKQTIDNPNLIPDFQILNINEVEMNPSVFKRRRTDEAPVKKSGSVPENDNS